ncbi:MAG TPA: hypothetical protein VFA93_02865 [Patescibacteria group bacterium]|nr:hypothetical protein [Patescibacteria group bacterium]
MLERAHFVDEKVFSPRRASGEFYIPPKESSPRVKTFTESKDMTFIGRFDFLEREFPQNRFASWVIEGGTGVALLVPHLDRQIRDFDILTTSRSMVDEFKDAWPYFHVRWVNDWLEKRGFPVTDDKITYIMRSRVPGYRDGRIAPVLAPALLAASKIHLYDTLPPRPQDILDVQSLNVPLPKIERVIQRLSA